MSTGDSQTLSGQRAWQRATGGVLLFAAMLLGTVHALGPGLPPLLVGLPGWAAAALLWPNIVSHARVQVLALLVAGLAGLIWAGWHNTPWPWAEILAGNAALIAMLAAVSFLQMLVASELRGRDDTPLGRRAIRGTIMGLHLLGSVINLSSLFIMAQRMAPDGRPDHRQLRLLTRGFAAAAFWSPFFIAMAAALSFAPGASLLALLAAGIPLAILGLIVTVHELEREDPRTFRGYPMGYRTLWLPGVFAALVLAAHWAYPEASVLGIVAALSPLLTALTLAGRREPVARPFRRQIVTGLPRMVNELCLFLAAGVMAGGLKAVFAATDLSLPFTRFGGSEASLLLCLLVALSIVGIHPVIGIAAAATLLDPLAPDPTLLAMCFLATWSIGMTVSPISGMNLAVQGTFGVSALKLMRWNLRYGLIMFVAAAAALNVYSWVALG